MARSDCTVLFEEGDMPNLEHIARFCGVRVPRLPNLPNLPAHFAHFALRAAHPWRQLAGMPFNKVPPLDHASQIECYCILLRLKPGG